MPFVMSLKQNLKAYTKNKGRAPVPGTEAELAKGTMVAAGVTTSPGPTPFVNRMKWVKWLPVLSELNVKLSENTRAAEGWVRKGDILSRRHRAVSMARRTSASIFTPNAGHTLRGMLLNSSFQKTFFDLFTSFCSKQFSRVRTLRAQPVFASSAMQNRNLRQDMVQGQND